MIHVALRGMMRRKLRTALTAIAIVLGVALITGTYVLTDSIKGAFGGIFTSVYRGTDATVTGKSAFTLSGQDNTTAPPFDQALLPKIRALPDVADAVGGVGGIAHLIVNGKVVAFGGAPNLGFSVDPTRPELNTLTLVDGKWPGPEPGRSRPGDSAQEGSAGRTDDRGAGERSDTPHEDLRPGALRGSGEPRRRDALGLRSPDGAAAVPARRKTRPDSREGEIRREPLAARRPDPRDPATGDTGEDRAGAGEVEDAKDTESFLNFLQDFLLAFGGIALFVGAFVIANSLSITITQRTRELATLRTLGASRRQVRASIVVEGIVDRHYSLGGRDRASAWGSASASSSCSMPSASRCRTTGSSCTRGP